MVINRKSKTDMSGLYIVFKHSAINEVEGFRGISHLIEHLLCKSLKPYYSKMDADNVEYNAYTSDSEVVFYMTGLERCLEKYRDIFVRAITTYEFSKVELNTEKKIVLDEILSYEGDQQVTHYHNLFIDKFNLYGPAGCKEDIKALTHKQCKAYTDTFFRKPSLIINVSKKCTSYSPDKDIRFSTDKYNTGMAIASPDAVRTFSTDNIFEDRSSVLFYTPNIITDVQDLVPARFICHMLSHGLTSPVMKILREKHGLAYDISFSTHILNDSSFIIAGGCTTLDENTSDVVKHMTKILKDYKTHMTRQRFNTIKSAFQVNLEISLIDLYNNASYLSKPGVWHMEHMLQGITLKDIKRVYDKYFTSMEVSIDKESYTK